MENVEKRACQIAGLKVGFDREEELYYNERKVKIYDAYILGYNDGKKETTELLTTLHKDIRDIS